MHEILDHAALPPLHRTACLGGLLLALLVGCDRSQGGVEPAGRLPALTALGARPGAAVVAQGQVEPAKGVMLIVAPAGDRVESIEVTEGQQVKAGDRLGRLASEAAKELELQIAIARRDEAAAKIKAEEAAATAKLDVAKVGLRQSMLAVDQAVKDLEEAESDGGKLALLEQQLSIAEAKLNQLRAAAGDRDTERLVTQSGLEQQQLLVDQNRSQLTLARREAKQKIAQSTLAIEAAEKEIRASELAVESAKAASGIQTMDKQIELLKLQLQPIKLLSPIDATVLSIDTRAGEPVGNAPIMRIADTRQMIVRAEVNVADIRRLSVGANATITSSALSDTLRGKVASISQLIGSPSLPSPNPMARVDWRSAPVVIEIDPESVPLAAERIQLQVDVAIEAQTPPPPALAKR
ncbi:MAG: HlyD family efflux transporter periplasmic adaptor subunit [Planctomycetaceae bacterium]